MYFVKTNMNQRSSKCLKIFTVEIELKAILLLYKQKEKRKKRSHNNPPVQSRLAAAFMCRAVFQTVHYGSSVNV